MLGNGHVQFGERAGETGQQKRWNRVPVRLYLWRDDGTDRTIHDLLRCRTREKAGRAEDPSAVAVDTQSVRAANHVPAATTGKDAIAGRSGPSRSTDRG